MGCRNKLGQQLDPDSSRSSCKLEWQGRMDFRPLLVSHHRRHLIFSPSNHTALRHHTAVSSPNCSLPEFLSQRKPSHCAQKVAQLSPPVAAQKLAPPGLTRNAGDKPWRTVGPSLRYTIPSPTQPSPGCSTVCSTPDPSALPGPGALGRPQRPTQSLRPDQTSDGHGA